MRDRQSRSGEISQRQALELAMRLLRGQWVIAIMVELAAGRRHYSGILHDVNALDDRVGRREHRTRLQTQVLSRTLTRMIADGLIIRQSSDDGDKVWYALTATGHGLLHALRPLGKWAARTYPHELRREH